MAGVAVVDTLVTLLVVVPSAQTLVALNVSSATSNEINFFIYVKVYLLSVPAKLSRHTFDDCDLLHDIIVPAGASKAFRKALHFIDGDTDFLVIEVARKKDDAKAQNDKKENVKAEESKKESKNTEETKKESKKSENKKESKKTEEKKSEEKKVQMPSDKNKKEEKKKAKA